MRRIKRQIPRQLVRRLLSNGRPAAARLWWAVRQIFGDAAYENYLRTLHAQVESTPGSASAKTPSSFAAPLSPAEFYLDSLRRRYSRISRCC
ncbi:MAG TPA: CstA-like transporter-associated (seleno)protein [Candidatus Acidoferrales bacterium]|jgi:hypothetical protein|nr:CstA-like transporter-associated (seleno)protein [Candidatus Acidoferrales bacterium]